MVAQLQLELHAARGVNLIYIRLHQTVWTAKDTSPISLFYFDYGHFHMCLYTGHKCCFDLSSNVELNATLRSFLFNTGRNHVHAGSLWTASAPWQQTCDGSSRWRDKISDLLSYGRLNPTLRELQSTAVTKATGAASRFTVYTGLVLWSSGVHSWTCVFESTHFPPLPQPLLAEAERLGGYFSCPKSTRLDQKW